MYGRCTLCPVEPPEEIDVRQYADQAMARLVATAGAAAGDWRETVDRGLAAAYKQGDIAGLTSMVQLVTHLLDGQGRYEDAIGELDHALAFARSSPDAAIVLHGIKACALAAPGRMDEARAALAEGQLLMASVSPASRTRYLVFRKAVSWQALDAEDAIGTESLLADCTALQLQRDRSFLLSWYIPALAATGNRRRAHPWIREIRIEARAANSVWRLSDAAAFEAWDDFLNDPEARSGTASFEQANAMSVWRGEAIRLRDAVLRRDGSSAGSALHNLRDARRRLASADVGLVERFERASRSTSGEIAETEAPAPPDAVNLNNLGTLLAEAESVGMSGTQFAAGTWLDTFTKIVPDTVQSCMEWPLSVSRVRGLLALRAGDLRRARSELQDALAWSVAMGFGTEEALARLQLGELCALADLRVSERTWKLDRSGGASRLSSRGYDPIPHAYAVAHSLTLASRNWLAERLTRREVQVLGLLSEDLSYREVAARLSIAPPTVQTLAHRVYEKLGISGRQRAVAEAKRLGIL